MSARRRRRDKPEPYDPNRGRHRKRASRETARWNAEHLMPACPAWLDRSTYVQLARLRGEL